MDKNVDTDIRQKLLRRIPKTDVLLDRQEIRCLSEEFGYEYVRGIVREELAALRSEIGNGQDIYMEEIQCASLAERIRQAVLLYRENSLRPVINATGVILHTNLGRAPLGKQIAEKLQEAAAGYSNLEYDLASGERGERYAHFEELICRVTGAEAALAVNNNAAAVLLMLNTLAKDGEVIVSRGELVEIGGKFRIPDVMERSGAVLREVGTTNRTGRSDYEDALNGQTKAILKVHTSNYRIVGFTESVGEKELAELAGERGVLLLEDLGSGVFIDLAAYGLLAEPTVQSALKNGADVVCFSGDKLMGGPQAGILAGRKQYIDLMKKNPLVRALRIDKFTAAALELTLREYLAPSQAVKRIPVLSMLTAPAEEIRRRAEKTVSELQAKIPGEIAGFETVLTRAKAGGGAMPQAEIPSFAVAVEASHITADALAKKLRSCAVPIIGRIERDRILLDLRTVSEEETAVLILELLALFNGEADG